MNYLKYKYLFKRIGYYFFGEKYYKSLKYDWSKYPNRTEVLQEIILVLVRNLLKGGEIHPFFIFIGNE